MEVIVKESYKEISALAAQMIAGIVRSKPDAVLGLATGSTPLGTYEELIRLHKEEGLDFSQVTTFNLDEYVGLPGDHPNSYRYYMNDNLFNHINIDKERTHLPDGMAEDIERSCQLYEEAIAAAGGIDLQFLGIGTNGHIAFNEPGSSHNSRTCVGALDERTISDNARFFNNRDEVPRYAITMGIGTIMDSRALILLANSEKKADSIARTVEGPITAEVPSTFIQRHRRATVIIDKPAASNLERQL